MKRFWDILVPLALLAGAAALSVKNPAPVERLRNLVFDTYQLLEPRPYDPEVPVRIADIDEKSLEIFGQWPWPRSQLAKVVDRLGELKAAAVAIDILLVEPDRTAPKTLAKSLPADKAFAAIRQLMGSLPDPDETLAKSVARVPTVVAFALLNSDPKRPQEIPAAKAGFAHAGDDPTAFVQQSSYWVGALPLLQQAAAGVGAVNIEPDVDGIIRRVPVFVRVPDSNPKRPFRGSLFAEALRIAQGATTYTVKSSGANQELSFGVPTGITKVKIGQYIVPTTADGSVLLYDAGHQSEIFLSVADLMSPDFDPAQVAGKIIFIGTSVEGLRDLKPTPLDPVMAGVEIQAQIVEQILGNQFLHRPDWAPGAELVFLVVFGLVLILLSRQRAAMSGLFIALLALGVAFGGSFYLFYTRKFLLDPLYPAGAAFLIFVASSLIGYIRTEREKAHVRGAFARYLSPVLVDQLSQHPERLKLGGEIRVLTLMFCDIRGFTKLSEGLDPEQLTSVINSFLTPMTRIIQGSGGTIDKYIGDCIMAFWNAPLDVENHPRMAILAALSMRAELKLLNAGFAAEAAKIGVKPMEIRVGIGLNTGKCCVGNMGSDQRFDYSAMGDTVNIASRLEGLSSAYSLDLVIGEDTAASVPDLALLEIDLVRVKGKTKPVRIFAGLGDATLAQSADFQSLKSMHGTMLAAFRRQDWDVADAALREAQRLSGTELQAFYGLYASRIAEYRLMAPGSGWDGVYVAKSKAG